MTTSSDESNQIFLAYSNAITDLVGIPTPIEGGQRLHLAPLSDYAIPSGQDINQNYENWNIYKFANTVPRDDQPLLSDSGVPVVTAYATYLADVDLSGAVKTDDQQAVTDAQADVKAKETQLINDIEQARTDFKDTFPGGKDDTTGDVITFAQYWPNYHPEIGTDKTALQNANKKYNELLAEQESSDLINQILLFKSNLAKGLDEATSYPNFNFPVNLSNPSDVTNDINNPDDANSTPLMYAPAFSIGGGFDTVIKSWVDNFPAEYPGDRTTFDQNATNIKIAISTSSDSTWESLGYSSSTTTTSSSGWIFWSYTDTTTNTQTSTNVEITRQDFSSSLSVSLWGFANFPIQYGAWYTGNPVHTFPTLNAAGNADPNVKADLLEQFVTVFMAYGVEISFTLSESAYKLVTGAISSASNKNGSLSIFGSIYNNSDTSSDSNSSSWSDLQTNDKDYSVTLIAKNNKLPIVLGAIANRLTS